MRKITVLTFGMFMVFADVLASDKVQLNGVTFVPADSNLIKTVIVDENKTITKYPSPAKVMEFNIMQVNGRSPVNENHYIYNSLVHFMIYVTKESGIFYVDDKKHHVKVGDVIVVPPKTRFAVLGDDLGYIAVENPAWFPQQHFIVDKNNQRADHSSIVK